MKRTALFACVLFALAACGGDDSTTDSGDDTTGAGTGDTGDGDGSGTGDGDGDGDDGGPLFEPATPCNDAATKPLTGDSAVVISRLEIDSLMDAFDLDGDGMPDNKLSAVSGLAREPIQEALEDYDILLPIELFDYPEVGEDECVKFAVYVGEYSVDRDDDDESTARENGDCNDTDPNISPDLPEIPDNGVDDDCDGLADEAPDGTPSDNAADADNDGLTIAQGDCDDTNPNVGGQDEICGDGLDNDCDGSADWQEDALGQKCTPYDDSATPDTLPGLDPVSFEDGEPAIVFVNGVVTREAGALILRGGPSRFALTVPISGDIALDLRITGAQIEAEIEELEGGIALRNTRLGGVIDAQTADKITGIEVEDIGLDPDNTLLDALFANILGTLLALPRLEFEQGSELEQYAGCLTPDIDVDGDGLEAFCDSTPDDEELTVDVCIDGDGNIFLDEGEVNCTTLTDDAGDPMFVDGVSVGLDFDTVPVVLPSTLP